MHRRYIPVLLLALAFWPAARAVPNQEFVPLAEVLGQVKQAQHRGGWFRDRCIYYQRVYLERFKNRAADGSLEDSFYRRQTVAEVSADQEGEVLARLVSDTDGDLQPKRVSGSSRNLFGAPRFLELLFFPLYPELVGMYEITDLGVSTLGERSARILRLFPRPGNDKQPLVEGLLYLDPATGAPIRLTIDRLHNFEALDSKLKDLLEFTATVEYRTLPNGVTVPARAEGRGNSRITRYKGYFRFKFEEWGYHPNPLYPDVNTWFEKMPGFEDNAPPADNPPDAGAAGKPDDGGGR